MKRKWQIAGVILLSLCFLGCAALSLFLASMSPTGVHDANFELFNAPDRLNAVEKEGILHSVRHVTFASAIPPILAGLLWTIFGVTALLTKPG